MTKMLRTAATAALVVAGTLAAPAGAQDIDCANLPQMETAEPAAFAHCGTPIVVENGGQAGSLPAWGVNLRASAPTGRGFITFDYADATNPTLLTFDDRAFYAGDFAGNDFTQVFAVQSLDVPSLHSIDAETGISTEIGSTGIATGSNVGGMAWDYETSTMFATSGANLYTVDLATGAMTLVAAITGGLTTPINLMAHPQTGVLYAVDLGTDDLWSIDKTTAASTLIGTIGILINFAQGADFDNATGVAYMCAYEGAGVNSVRSINLATGATTQVSAFTNSEVDICASTTPRVNPANEPSAPSEVNLIVEPNPFSQQTQLVMTVVREQQVRVEVYDMVGRQVAVLHDALVPAGQPIVVTLLGSDLEPGVYAVRATGETFVRTQQMTVAR